MNSSFDKDCSQLQALPGFQKDFGDLTYAKFQGLCRRRGNARQDMKEGLKILLVMVDAVDRKRQID